MKHLMKRLLIISSAFTLLFGLSPAVQAHPLPSTAAIGSAVPPEQYLRTGFTIKPLPVYASLAGRAASVTAEVQSAYDTQVFFVFSAPAGRRSIHRVSFYILKRTGDYTGDITMTLAVYDYAGNLQHLVSTASVGLKTAAAQVWTALPLSSNVADRLIEPGEFLAVHFALSEVPGGNLDVRPVFEVAQGPIQLFRPVITH